MRIGTFPSLHNELDIQAERKRKEEEERKRKLEQERQRKLEEEKKRKEEEERKRKLEEEKRKKEGKLVCLHYVHVFVILKCQS